MAKKDSYESILAELTKRLVLAEKSKIREADPAMSEKYNVALQVIERMGKRLKEGSAVDNKEFDHIKQLADSLLHRARKIDTENKQLRMQLDNAVALAESLRQKLLADRKKVVNTQVQEQSTKKTTETQAQTKKKVVVEDVHNPVGKLAEKRVQKKVEEAKAGPVSFFGQLGRAIPGFNGPQKDD